MFNNLKEEINQSLKLFLADIRKNYKLHLISPVLIESIKEFLSRTGKRIRPILYITSYTGYKTKNKIDYPGLLRSSLSLELLHCFMLAHDDIIDNSKLRRGKPTLHRVFNKRLNFSDKNDTGKHLSIVAGDIIFSLGIEAFLSVREDAAKKEKTLQNLLRTTVFTGTGEFIDVINSSKGLKNISQKDIYANYMLKTAKYTFESPLTMGATLAGASQKEIAKLSMLGLILGEAFQIQDDLLDIFSNQKKTGKSSSDIDEAKKTLLLWKTYKSVDKSDKIRLETLLKKGKKNKRDIKEVKDIILGSKSAHYCRKKITTLLKQANLLQEKLKIKEKQKQMLQVLINKIFSKAKFLDSAIITQ